MDYLKFKKFLEDDDFQGFVTVYELTTNPSKAPSEQGIYLILRKTNDSPEFMEVGTGGFFKGKDPNVSITELQNNWVENSPVLYIGKAGGKGKSATLQSRLKQYMQFGQGKNIGHQGGCYIWQLKDSQELIVCWKSLGGDKEPRSVEHEMIEKFKQKHNGMRPFANLQD